MSFHKIDQFIGRHMSAERWLIVWIAVALGGAWFMFRGWWAFLGAPMAIAGAFGIVGNARRLR